jgi:hypothetical protein
MPYTVNHGGRTVYVPNHDGNIYSKGGYRGGKMRFE